MDGLDRKFRRNIGASRRNLDSLVNCSELFHGHNSNFSEWQRRSVSSSDRDHHFDNIIPEKILANSTTRPSPWYSSEEPRWFHFWSDLAEERPKFYPSWIASPPPSERLFSSSTVDADLAKASADEAAKFSGCNPADLCLPRWVMVYLEELANVLRNGGWKEQDINDMLLQVSSSSNLAGAQDMIFPAQLDNFRETDFESSFDIKFS